MPDPVENLIQSICPESVGLSLEVRSKIIRALGPVFEDLDVSGEGLSASYHKGGQIEVVLCCLRVTSAGPAMHIGYSPTSVPRGEESRALAKLNHRLQVGDWAAKLQPRVRRRVRRPGGNVVLPAKLDPQSRAVIRLRHDLTDDVECPRCSTLVFRWNFAHHVANHAPPEPPHSVWTVSGGGGPGTGKRR